MTYDEAVKIIDSLLVFGSKPGLERVGELIQRIGSPDKQLKFIHIAGTNGKGSVCAMLSSILKEAGFKTGMFISPYVLEFRERFQVNGCMIPPQVLADIVEELYPVVLEMKNEDKIITEFEFVFAIAMKWFQRMQCDIVVLETGLGGRFDATNIINTPLASVIMSISLDHTAILGDTYEKIAFEKCGIIKNSGTTVLYGEQPDGVYDVVKKAAAEKNNQLLIADPSAVTKLSSGLEGSDFLFCDKEVFGGKTLRLHIPFIGEHQLKNSAAALFTIWAIRKKGIEVSEEAIVNGLKKAFFPARLELMRKSPVVLLDGAHNPGGAGALSDALDELLADTKNIAIVGMLADKDVDTSLSKLARHFEKALTVTPDNPRAMSAEALAEKLSALGVPAQPCSDYSLAYKKALALSEEFHGDSAIVIFGSLYLAADIRKIIE